jgi:hypothetical protein
MTKRDERDLSSLVAGGEPVVIVVLSNRGVEKSLIFHDEGDPVALGEGNLLLAKIAPHLMLIDSALRSEVRSCSNERGVANRERQ